jgi:putative sigma-54 modulation protein
MVSFTVPKKTASRAGGYPRLAVDYESRSRTGVNLTVKGRNLILTEAIGSYAEEKMSRLGKYLADGSRCEVELWTEKNPSIADNQVVEATIFTKGPVIRAREASPDIYASIDLVLAKLERQVKKYRGKLLSRSQGAHKEALALEGFTLPEGAEAMEEDAPAPRIVKTKQFMIKPMTPEEAALQLELVGHDFFVFTKAESQETAVVYRRRDGHYGLIEAQS